MAMDGNGNERSAQGDSASPVRGACFALCSLSTRAAWHGIHLTTSDVPALPTDRYPTPPTPMPTLPDMPDTESSRPCFVRHAANGASTDTQELQAPPILPWAHCGTEADGKVGSVRVGIGMRCHPCVRHRRSASQGPLRGSVPGGRGSHWINAILVPLARSRVCGCASHLLRWGREHASPMG